jgi:hypothetical protein
LLFGVGVWLLLLVLLFNVTPSFLQAALAIGMWSSVENRPQKVVHPDSLLLGIGEYVLMNHDEVCAWNCFPVLLFDGFMFHSSRVPQTDADGVVLPPYIARIDQIWQVHNLVRMRR